MRWLSRYWYVFVFVIVNLAIAQPAQAKWDNDSCVDPETGGEVGCCTVCYWFCDCDYPDQ